MVCLGRIELLARLDGCDDRGRKDLRRVKLRYISRRDPTLLGILREDGRAILRTDIGTLAIELGGIVRHGEIDLKDAAVGDAMRVEGDLHRFRMARGPATGRLVFGRVSRPAGIAR